VQYLESNELARLFRVMYAENKTHHMAALTCFFSGARISQVLRLQGQDIFEANGRMVIKIHAAKRGFERLHPLHFDVQPEFDMSPLILLAQTRRLSRLWGGLSRQFFNLSLKRYCALAGIHQDAGHSHIFRHSISMIIWHQTHNLGAISHFLAHRSPASAFSYLQANNGIEAQEAVDSLQLA